MVLHIVVFNQTMAPWLIRGKSKTNGKKLTYRDVRMIDRNYFYCPHPPPPSYCFLSKRRILCAREKKLAVVRFYAILGFIKSYGFEAYTL